MTENCEIEMEKGREGETEEKVTFSVWLNVENIHNAESSAGLSETMRSLPPSRLTPAAQVNLLSCRADL